jgi:putative ABC transport system substrate-binding protein
VQSVVAFEAKQMMDRRTFLATPASGLVAILGSLAVARVGHGQTPPKLARIGIMLFDTPVNRIAGPDPPSTVIRAFLRGMRERGYVYGRDFVTEARGEEPDRNLWPGQAAELVRLRADVILCAGQQMRACKEATSTVPVPIVMIAAGDPVGDGFVQSLARPGGNITGLSDQGDELVEKRWGMLKELVPSNPLVAVIHWDVVTSQRAEVFAAPARKQGLQLLWLTIGDASEIEGAFRAAVKAGAGSVFVSAERFTFPHRRRVAELALENRLPTMFWWLDFVRAGGLIAYNADFPDIWYRAAGYVDKILNGAKPGDLPIEQPVKFKLVINLNTAKALGIKIPQSLLLSADEVIQ